MSTSEIVLYCEFVISFELIYYSLNTQIFFKKNATFVKKIQWVIKEKWMYVEMRKN